MAKTLRMLLLAEARRIVSAAEAEAVKIGLPYNIAVVDAAGNLICQVRMDGGWFGSIDLAIGKAWTASAFENDTASLAAMAQSGQPLFGIHTTNRGKVVIFGGGVPLRIDGEVVGAIGASGGTVEQDIAVALAGAAALV